MSGEHACELRVHGIGTHSSLSAIGAPRLVDMSVPAATSTDPLVAVYAPPVLPEHDVQMLNWSRVTRRRFGPGWWLSFPLTLANTAGYMVPIDQEDARFETGGRPTERSQLHAAAVSLATTVMTAGYVLWSFALVETLPAELSPVLFVALEIGVAILLVALMLRRLWREPSHPIGPDPIAQPRPRFIWIVQVFAVIAVAAVILICHPSHVKVETEGTAVFAPRAWVSSCWSVGGENAGCENRLDVLSTYIIVTSLMAAAAVVISACAATSGRQRRSSAFRASLTIAIAFLLMNAIFAGLRTGLSWLAYYPERRILRTGRLCERLGTQDLHECVERVQQRRSLLPFSAKNSWQVFDLPPVGVVWLLIPTLLVLSVLRVRDRRRGREQRVAWAQRVHNIIVGLPWNARLATSVAAVLVIAGGVGAYLIGASRAHVWWWIPSFVVGAIDISALLVPLVVLAMVVLTPVRTAVSFIGDVVGYWPRRFAVLAGASYTDGVCNAIASSVRSPGPPIALVGHSQGSVLCYTALARMEAVPDRVRLATCGSPLKSLYQGFFPSYFQESDFRSLRQELRGQWANFWRDTDPIATPLFDAADDEDLQIPDTGLTKPDAHSDYWTEPIQMNRIQEMLDNELLSTPVGITDA